MPVRGWQRGGKPGQQLGIGGQPSAHQLHVLGGGGEVGWERIPPPPRSVHGGRLSWALDSLLIKSAVRLRSC